MGKTKTINSIQDCIPQRSNANKHTQRGLGLLEDSIGRDGWLGAITVASDGETFDGSARLEVGASAGFSDAIVVDSDGSRPVVVRRTDIATADDPKAKRLGIAANRIAQIDLDWDTDVLTQLAADGMDLSDLFTGDEFSALLQDEEGTGGELLTDADEVPDNAPTRCKTGDLWQLGRHRLLCGDSTKREDVERLMGGEKAQMVWSDPPYGISVVNAGGTVGVSAAAGFDKKKGKVGVTPVTPAGTYAPIIGDETTDTATNSFDAAFNLYPRAVHIWWGGNFYAGHLPNSPHWIIWDKQTDGNQFADAELAWTNQKGALRQFRHQWMGMLRASERGEKRVHPTQKPVALAEWCFEKYGNEGDVILDPFLGSGMSIIAAEKTNRTVRGVEMSPEYCDVIIARFENATGTKAELNNNGSN